MFELQGTITGRFETKDGGLVIPRTKMPIDLLKEDYTMVDLFEMGQSSYEMSLNDYMFIVNAQKKDCLLFFICQAGGITGTRMIEFDLEADEPSMSLVMPEYDFVLTIVCSSIDLLKQQAIIYTNVSDLPDGMHEILMNEAKPTY